MSPTDETVRPLTATELRRSQECIRRMIADSVQRRDRQGLDAISMAVYALEQELAEAYWEIDWARKGITHVSPSRIGVPLLEGLEGYLQGISCCLMSHGVQVARWAARIRSRLKPGFPRLHLRTED